VDERTARIARVYGVTLVVNDGSAAGYLQPFYRVFKSK
jgi:hypothetical protein